MVMSVQSGEAAATSGLKPGDRILSIGDVSLGSGELGGESSRGADPSTPRAIPQPAHRAQRGTTAIDPHPLDQQGTGRIGAQLQEVLTGESRPVASPWEAITVSSHQFSGLVSRTAAGYAGLFTNFGSHGPAGVGSSENRGDGRSTFQPGGSGLALFVALISINLAVLNALPLPLLDGGQAVLLLLEGLRAVVRCPSASNWR